jgi:hypothetical protein
MIAVVRDVDILRIGRLKHILAGLDLDFLAI